MTKFKLTYVKTKTIVIDETTIIVEAEDPNTAVKKGYVPLLKNDPNWELDNCEELVDSGVI